MGPEACKWRERAELVELVEDVEDEDDEEERTTTGEGVSSSRPPRVEGEVLTALKGGPSSLGVGMRLTPADTGGSGSIHAATSGSA